MPPAYGSAGLLQRALRSEAIAADTDRNHLGGRSDGGHQSDSGGRSAIVICRREGTFASYSAARRMRRCVTASSHLTSASVSGPAAPPAPRRPSVHGIFPSRELADCAQHRLIHREPGRCLIAVPPRFDSSPVGMA